MIEGGAGLLGWYIGFGIGIAGTFAFAAARGMAAAFRVANQTINEAVAEVTAGGEPGRVGGNAVDPGRVDEWDPWQHPVLLAAEQAERR